MTSGRAPVAAVVVLAVAGLLVSLAAAWPGPDRSSTGGSYGQSARAATRPDDARSASAGGAARDQSPGRRRAGSDPAGSPLAPARLRIPAIGLTAPVQPVGVGRGLQMQLPDDPDVVGWYRFGPGPGSGRGSVVLAGHLDSVRFGVGALVRLRDTAPGDVVLVKAEDGTRRDYRVTAVDRFDRQQLPDRLFRRDGREMLTVITCGGDYDADQGGYQQNLVVSARPD